MSEPGAALGVWGEERAAAFLENRGLRIVARGFRCRFGEIDLVAEDHDVLVFCEVKTRRPGSLGLPQEAVSRNKQRKLIKTAGWYLSRSGWDGGVRFDVLAVTPAGDSGAEIEWFVDAFSWE